MRFFSIIRWKVLLLCMSIVSLGFAHQKFFQVKKQAISTFQKELCLLQKSKKKLEMLKMELQQRAQSKNDPDWIERVLMQKLGLVPKGYMKVHFVPQVQGEKRTEDR
ncbi:MAG: hypothetical protein AAGI90_06215 [Chlamydiota bacterium]